MLRTLLFVLCIFCIASVSAQRLQLGLGMGMGSAHSNLDRFGNPFKIYGYLESRYRLNENFGVGLELGLAGPTLIERLQEELGEGGQAAEIELDPTRAIASSYLAKGIYYLPNLAHKKRRVYVALGIGLNKYTYNLHIEDLARAHRVNFALQPEIGLQFGGFHIHYRHLIGGRSPGFTKLTSNGQAHTMPEARVNLSLFSFGYLFTLKK